MPCLTFTWWKACGAFHPPSVKGAQQPKISSPPAAELASHLTTRAPESAGRPQDNPRGAGPRQGLLAGDCKGEAGVPFRGGEPSQSHASGPYGGRKRDFSKILFWKIRFCDFDTKRLISGEQSYVFLIRFLLAYDSRKSLVRDRMIGRSRCQICTSIARWLGKAQTCLPGVGPGRQN